MSRRKPCPRPDKQRHTSADTAWAAARSLRARRNDGVLLTAYPCGDHWHVGNGRLTRLRRTA